MKNYTIIRDVYNCLGILKNKGKEFTDHNESEAIDIIIKLINLNVKMTEIRNMCYLSDNYESFVFMTHKYFADFDY